MGSKGIDIIIPKDIREYKAKAIGPFTIRQSVTVLVISAIAFFVLWFEREVLMMEHTTLMPALFFSIIPGLFGFGDKLVGMPFEVYLKRVFFSAVIAPKHRVYQSHSYFDIMAEKMEEMRVAEQQLKEQEEKKVNKGKGKKKDKPKKTKINPKTLPPELRPYE